MASLEGADSSGVDSVVSIPIKSCGSGDNNVQEFIDIRGSELPKVEDVIAILTSESASVETWHRVAVLYHRSGFPSDCLRIADEGWQVKKSQHNLDLPSTSVVPLLLTIGGHFYMAASANADGRREKYLASAKKAYNRAFTLGINGFEVEYYVGWGYYKLITGEPAMAKKSFSLVLNSFDKDYVPAIVGLAFLAFAEKDYQLALQHFRHALLVDPLGPTNVRVGIGHCFWRLGQREKAKIAYERALEVKPDDHNAICALATYYLSTLDPDKVKIGVQLLVKAYSICPTHPATNLFLADHYYYRKEFSKALEFALDICTKANSDDIRQRSAYLAGRCYQAKGEHKHAMHYYYQALSESDTVSQFLLPYFGLAQCYMHFDDLQHCSDTLVKLLVRDPSNHFAKKMLGSLECTSTDPAKRETAQKHLKAVLESDPTDVSSRLSFATALESFDDNEARGNYRQAIQLINKKGQEVDPIIHNNLACTLFRLKEYVDALDQFETALEIVNCLADSDSTYRPLLITLNFNIARTREALHHYKIAETIYKEILKKHPSYFSCFIRLAVIYRDMNNLHVAEEYFKEALQCSVDHPDVWAYIGKLHLALGETMPAQKKFMKILQMNEYTHTDAYSLIALGNVDLTKLLNCIFDTTPLDLRSVSKYMKSAADFYESVICREPNNIWAANGMGCILAAKGLFTDAREVFSQVREATQDYKDVWINIANTYLEQGSYFPAIQMYEGCNKKFGANTDIKLLQCLAKAYSLNKQYHEAKVILLKCRRVAPYDSHILFALAKTLRKIGWQPFHIHGSPDLGSTLKGLHTLKHAKKMFECLSNKQSNSSHLINAAAIEVKHCDDLIRQTPHMISRIEADCKKEQKLKNKREKEVRAFKEKQRREQELLDRKKRKEDEEALRKREAVKIKVEKVRNTLELEASHEAKKRERKMKREKDKEALIDHSFIDYDDDDYASPKATPPPSQKSRPRKKKELKSKVLEGSAFAVNNDINGPKGSSTKSYSRIITPETLFDDSDENEPALPTEDKVVKPRRKYELSPDITCLPIIKKAPGSRVKSPQTPNDTDSQEDSLLYLDIFSSNGNQPGITDSSCVRKRKREGEDSPNIYDDLPPPELQAFHDISWEINDDDDSPPPILHSIHSDDEN